MRDGILLSLLYPAKEEVSPVRPTIFGANWTACCIARAHWPSMARHARTLRQMEFRLRSFSTVGRERHMGCFTWDPYWACLDRQLATYDR